METWYATSSIGDDWHRPIDAGTFRRGLLAATLTLLAGGSPRRRHEGGCWPIHRATAPLIVGRIATRSDPSHPFSPDQRVFDQKLAYGAVRRLGGDR